MPGVDRRAEHAGGQTPAFATGIERQTEVVIRAKGGSDRPFHQPQVVGTASGRQTERFLHPAQHEVNRFETAIIQAQVAQMEFVIGGEVRAGPKTPVTADLGLDTQSGAAQVQRFGRFRFGAVQACVHHEATSEPRFHRAVLCLQGGVGTRSSQYGPQYTGSEPPAGGMVTMFPFHSCSPCFESGSMQISSEF